MKMQGVLNSLVALLVSTLLGACGGLKTNPAESYNDLKSFNQPTDKKSRPQVYCDWVFPPPEYDVINFVEGTRGEFQISAGVTLEGVGYRINAQGLPEGASFSAGKEPGKYILSWTPSIGTLAKNANAWQDSKFQISLEILSASGDAAGCVAPVNGKTYDVKFVVHKSGDLPMIKSAAVASAEVVQGDTVAVVVEGVDPSATQSSEKGTAPKIEVADERGGVNVVRGASAVTFGEGILQENGLYRFEGKFDSSKVNIPDRKLEVTARVIVRLRSQVDKNKVSAGRAIDIKVIKKSTGARS